MAEYELMNKNTPILAFAASHNTFGQPVFTETCRHAAPLPIGYTDIGRWLNGRRAPAHRAHIAAILARYGCNDLETYAEATRAVSLNDTFWVRKAGSGEKWEDVSPYTNDLDGILSNLAFDGMADGTSVSSISPEFGTDGAFAKCWIRDKEGTWLLKRGFERRHGDGLEPYSEKYASEIAEIICSQHVPYEITKHHGRIVSKCPLFTDESTGYVPFYRAGSDTRDLAYILDVMAGYGAEEDFRRMMVFDAVILNTDRHAGNYGFLFDTDTMEIMGMAPVFDNNQSLLSWANTEEIRNNPEYCLSAGNPKFGGDFVAIARQMLTPEIRSDLINLRGFTFSRDGEYGLSEARLAALEYIVNIQIDSILGRERIVAIEAGRERLQDWDEPER